MNKEFRILKRKFLFILHDRMKFEPKEIKSSAFFHAILKKLRFKVLGECLLRISLYSGTDSGYMQNKSSFRRKSMILSVTRKMYRQVQNSFIFLAVIKRIFADLSIFLKSVTFNLIVIFIIIL